MTRVCSAPELCGQNQERGLYVHIPFCERKCHYCNYVITTRQSEDFRKEYFEAFEKEVKHAKETYGELTFDTLYLGGGTPSAIEAREMTQMLNSLRGTFHIKDKAETTCEMNPGDATEEKLEIYRALGINRISLGVQTFDDAFLENMGRSHDSEAIYSTFFKLREKGFENISIDLITRLPGQTPGHWEETLQTAVKLGPDQIVIYDLNVHPGTVFGKRLHEGRLNIPSEPAHEGMSMATERILAGEHDFVQYEISSFAKRGFESKHNLIYWHNQEYLGLGPGAFSYLNGMRFMFSETVNRYIEKISRNDWTKDQENILKPQEIQMESVLTGLRLQNGIDISEYPLMKDHLAKEIPKLKSHGLLGGDQSRVKLTARGRRLAETVFTELSA